MTQTPPLAGTATGRPTPTPTRTPTPTPTRRILRALAIAACVPYISLKIAWIAGSEIGIPAGSVLLDHRTLLIVANSVSVVMDAMVVLLALLLTQPWGLRVRAWLLAFPLWAATGLLSPIMIGFPAQLALSLFAGPRRPEAGGRPFLDEWVFGAVYGGFIGQGLALGALFVLYTRDRWAHVWRGTLGDLPVRLSGTAVRVTAAVAALLALAPSAVRLMWALGGAHGLSAGQFSQGAGEFHLLEWVRLLFTVVAVVTVLMLVFAGNLRRRTGSLSVRTPLGLAWVATGGVGCWGAYMTLVAFLPDTDPDKAFTGLARLTYAGEMITGFLLAACVAAFLRRRSASA